MKRCINYTPYYNVDLCLRIYKKKKERKIMKSNFLLIFLIKTNKLTFLIKKNKQMKGSP